MIHKVTNLRREASMIFLQQCIQSYLTTLTTEGKSPTYTEWLGRRLRAEKRLAEGNSISHTQDYQLPVVVEGILGVALERQFPNRNVVEVRMSNVR